MGEYVVGIDFGTTNSRITFIPVGQLVMNLKEQLSPIRTAVWPTRPNPSKEEYICYLGQEAIERGRLPSFKLEMGKLNETHEQSRQAITFKEIEVKGNYGTMNFRPEELAACIIAKLREMSISRNNKLENIRNVTITVPAEWTFLQRRATIFAAQIAGYDNIRTLQEPVAAFLYLSEVMEDEILDPEVEVKNILVFDFGGGTCDISIIVRENKKALPFVLAGNMVQIGGEIIDKRLSPYLVSGAHWEKASNGERAKLAEKAKQLKEHLNPRNPNVEPLAAGIIKGESVHIADADFTISEFSLEQSNVQEVVKTIVPSLKEALDIALKRANLKTSDIDRVLMVGGSSYLRDIQNFIEDYLSAGGKKLSINNGGIILRDAEEAIAFGAAIHQYQKRHRKKVIRSSLSLETYLKYKKSDGESGRYMLGSRGQPLPIPSTPRLLHKFFKAFLFDTVPLPNNLDKVEWYVWQKRIRKKTGDQEEQIVEKVSISEYKPGYATRLRIVYRIDEEGNLTFWEPYLITDRGFPVVTINNPETSLYDLTEKKIPEIRKKMGIKFTS